MARQVRGWDAVRAWRFIRASKAYRTAWDRHRPTPGLPERAPFAIRLRTAADMGALRFGMLAWEDPWAALPLAPFWASAGVLDGRVARGATPLVRLAAEGGATLSGLRLGDGALMVRIEGPGRSMQVRFPAGTVFPEDGGLHLIREVERIEDVWLGAPLPRSGRARGTTATGSFCWRSNARRRGSRCASSRSGSGAPNGSRRNTTPASGCTCGSSAAGPAQGPS
ncbi:MAG: hypothetical protein OXF40_12005 [Rhodospirillales bacterium]|nr:hypothetical protein [Rhodospirillales bacterium]